MQTTTLRLAPADTGTLARDVLGNGHVLRYTARGRSMRPFIHDGDILDVKAVAATDLRRGDIILHLTLDGNAKAHRVLRIVKRPHSTVVLTRGDASGGDPDRVPAEDVLGRVQRLQRGQRVILPSWPWRWLGYGWSICRAQRSKWRRFQARRQLQATASPIN